MNEVEPWYIKVKKLSAKPVSPITFSLLKIEGGGLIEYSPSHNDLRCGRTQRLG